MWIQFTSDCIIDMLQIFGFISGLPPALFGLTVLAWGNCLGDMSADVAMTKKGFGEMAITGTMAGPIFNILVGQGLSLTLGILKQEDPWNTAFKASAFTADGSLETTAVLPLTIIVGLLCVLALLLVNALKTNFKISYKW